MKKNNLIYITETSIPSLSANLINSLKFCDAFAKTFNVNFFLPKCDLSDEEINRDYSLENNIYFNQITKIKISNSFLRFYYCVKVVLKIFFYSKNIDIIISRSIICSLFLAITNIKNVVEIHHNLSGFTSLLFNFILKTNFKKNLVFIIINKKLIKDLNIENLQYIVLDDGSDVKKFKVKHKNKFRNACVYTGSFFNGKGIDLILKLSKLMPHIDFHLYGDLSTIKNDKFKKILNNNIKFMGFVKYSRIRYILSRYHIALMPYENRIYARSSTLEISKYISPLKMFDYFSSRNIILASKIKAFEHIMKNNINSFILSNKNLNDWKLLINKILKNTHQFEYIKYNGFLVAKKYSWKNRSKKLLHFLNKN